MSKCDMVLSRKVSSSSCRSSFKNSPGFPVPASETTRPMSRSSVAEASCLMKSSWETSSTTTRCSTPYRLLNSTPTSLSKSSRRATRTILIPEAAICCANSLPIPDEPPVTSAQGPNLFLSSATVIFSLRSACLACRVCCVINYSFELIPRSEHTIDRSAHLLQNKSRRQAIHHFELIRLTRTNFKSIGLHSFDGDFNHVFHLHDRSAFLVFNIKVTQEFGLCHRRCQLKYLHFGVFQLHTKRLGERMQSGLGGATNR